MSESPKSTPSPKAAAPKSTETTSSTAATSKSDTTKSSDSTTSATTGSDAGKSSRESIGGSSAVHYGFFSNVKSPEYRSGWDDIWSKKTATKKKKRARAKEPVVISLALEDLPDELQAGLVEVARARLKKSRINYDNRTKTGAVTWRIDCEVRR